MDASRAAWSFFTLDVLNHASKDGLRTLTLIL